MTTTWHDLKVEILVPQASVNYVTNPSFETGTTGYTEVGGTAVTTISRVTTEQRRGAYGLEITPTASQLSGVYFGTVSAVDGEDYAFSVDLKGAEGVSYQVYIANTGGTALATTNHTGIGEWVRIEVDFTATATESWRLYIVRVSTGTDTSPFYIDGLQFENKSEATTYFDGDCVGFVSTRNDFGWNGTRHGSTSYRTAKTRAGGSLLNLADYGTVLNLMGLGMGQFSQSYIDISTGGALYEKHARNTNPFSVIMSFSGANHGEMAAKRAAVINAVRPDTTDDQPLVVRVTAIDENGNPGGEPVDIPCMLLPSMTDTPQLPTSQQVVLQFRSLDALIPGAFHEGAQLDFVDSLTNANHILMRDSDGVWRELATGLGDIAYCMVEGPDGYIYIGGSFTNAGGDANADYLCKWDGTSFSPVVSGINDNVYALAFDASGNLYIGGDFINLGDANGDFIVKWDGTSVSSLGTGLNGSAHAIAIDALGNVYVGGYFSTAGGTTVNYIAKWNGSSWSALDSGVAGTSNHYVKAIAIAKNGDLYAAGSFDEAGSGPITVNGLARWDGTAWNDVGGGITPSANGDVKTIAFAPNGDLYIGGDFTTTANGATDYLAVWNGSLITEVSGGSPNNFVAALSISESGELYVGGGFTAVGELNLSDSFAVLRNSAWVGADIKLPGPPYIYSILNTDGGYLYFGFTTSGTATAAGVTTVTNNGGAIAYPEIRLTGPGVVYQIKDSISGAQITFSNLTLLTGEILTLNLEPDNITVQSSFRGDCLNYISEGSDLANFYLQPGTNNISLLMTGTDANSSAVMYWKPKYWSMDQTRFGV